jgi:hypothetical protein
MANPNIAALTTIKGQTAYVVPLTTGANTAWQYDGTTSLPGLTPAAGTVNRVTGIVVANQAGVAANCTVAIGNNPTFGSSTVISYLAYLVTVPAQSSLVVLDKTTDVYITENQSMAVNSGAANALTYTVTFEAIS